MKRIKTVSEKELANIDNVNQKDNIVIEPSPDLYTILPDDTIVKSKDIDTCTIDSLVDSVYIKSKDVTITRAKRGYKIINVLYTSMIKMKPVDAGAQSVITAAVCTETSSAFVNMIPSLSSNGILVLNPGLYIINSNGATDLYLYPLNDVTYKKYAVGGYTDISGTFINVLTCNINKYLVFANYTASRFLYSASRNYLYLNVGGMVVPVAILQDNTIFKATPANLKSALSAVTKPCYFLAGPATTGKTPLPTDLVTVNSTWSNVGNEDLAQMYTDYMATRGKAKSALSSNTLEDYDMCNGDNASIIEG